jgi:oligoribonuclease
VGLTSDAKAILWVDLETTGSSELEDEIIEVGAILTDFELVVIGSTEAVCRPTQYGYDRLIQNDVVRKMHTDNGLLQELDRGRDLRAVDEELFKFVRLHVPKGRVILAGSGVSHFDRKFIDSQLWVTAELLTYPTLDIGVVRRFNQKCCGFELQQDGQPSKNHRAFADIMHHLNEARQYRQFIRKATQNA